MADVITRFKLETTQYDSKLREASKKLSDFTKEAATYGNEFSKFTQKNIEAARAFGQVATSATNSKDKVKELVGAFNDVAKSYNALTKEQQQSDFGKALAESMTTLKGRIAEAKQEMNSTGGVLGVLKDKFTVNIDALKLFNLGVQGAKAALGVAKDAFFASEASVDEWGRTMKAAEGLYEGFLNALNTGDISGYLSRMDEIVRAAREAYNELDKLGTMKTIQSPQFAKQEAENNRLRTMLMTGRWISAGDGRGSMGLKNGDILNERQLKVIERMLQNGMNSIVSLTKNELQQTGKAIDAYYNNLAKQNGMSLSEFRQGTSSWGAFSEKMAGYEAYKKWNAQAQAEFARQGGRGYVDFDKSNPYAEFRKWGVFRVDKMEGDSYNNLVNLIKQQQSQQSQMYSTLGQAYRTINRAEGITVKGLMGGGGGSGKGGGSNTTSTYDVGSLAEAQAEVQRLAKLWNEAGADVRNQYLQPLIEAEAKVKSMQNAMNLQKEQAQGKLQGGHIMKTNLGQDTFAFDNTLLNNREKFLDELNKYFKDHPIVIPMDTSNNDVKKIQETARKTAAVVGTIGQAFNQIENPAAKVAGTVAQAIANVAMAYSQTLAEDKTTKENIWAFIAAAAASTISMVQTISSIHSATGYKNGGVVKGYASGGMADGMGGGMITGTTYSNDQIPIMANAGEVILNKAQQASVAGQLQGSGLRGMSLKTKVKGTELLVWLDNSLAQSGRGELMTWGQ